MLSSFVIVLREGFEAFLIVAIIVAYLRKTGRAGLIRAVYVGLAAALAVSVALGWVLRQGANRPLWEGVLALVTVPFIVGLVIHMWRTGPQLKQRMEATLQARTAERGTPAAFLGVFLFTVLMVSREGMETALMLFQVHTGNVVAGSALGALAALGMAWAFAQYGHRINVRRFFQVTGVFLLLFTVQILLYGLHELSEAGIVVNNATVAFHVATEPFSPYGQYGKWFPLFMVGVPAIWLLAGGLRERLQPARQST